MRASVRLKPRDIAGKDDATYFPVLDPIRRASWVVAMEASYGMARFLTQKPSRTAAGRTQVISCVIAFRFKANPDGSWTPCPQSVLTQRMKTKQEVAAEEQMRVVELARLEYIKRFGGAHGHGVQP